MLPVATPNKYGLPVSQMALVLNLPLNYINLIKLTFFFSVLCFLCLLHASPC